MPGYIRLLAVAAVLNSSAAAQTLPFEGKWASRLEMCVNDAGTSSPAGGVLITLTARRLVSSVMSCEFRSVLPGGMSYRIEASCQAALGQRGEEFFTFAVLDGRLHWTWAGKTGIFERCPN